MTIDRIDITAQLFALQDKAYADFQSKLLPTVKRETVIGVRTPDLRKMAKQICKTPAAQEFLQSLPHRYFDENQVHAFILSEEKDFEMCIDGLEQFLPYVDNWATCDQLSPRCFNKHMQELLPFIRKWMRSKHTYTKRFGIVFGRSFPTGVLRAGSLHQERRVLHPHDAGMVLCHSACKAMGGYTALYRATSLGERYA